MKAIETYYKGYRFRSRTEARWAVFFDKLGLRWDYEEEGYVLPKTGCYLPDFKVILPSDEIIYCEVNHSEADDFADDEIRKLREFAHERRCKVILLTGVPDFRAYNQLVCRIRSRAIHPHCRRILVSSLTVGQQHRSLALQSRRMAAPQSFWTGLARCRCLCSLC